MNYFLRQKAGLCPSVAYQNISKKEDQAMNFIPVHPAQNLHLSDGVYVAEIRDVEERVYKVEIVVVLSAWVIRGVELGFLGAGPAAAVGFERRAASTNGSRATEDRYAACGCNFWMCASNSSSSARPLK